MYDILIIGAGLFGSVCASELCSRGFRCLVLEKRGHIGGNCYTRVRDAITVHEYGPHVFHTSDTRIWEWINRFAAFNHYRHRVKVNYKGKLYSFPINLATFYEIWQISTPEAALKQLERVRVPLTTEDNLENWILSQVGVDMYRLLIEGYTRKQWGKAPTCLPSSIIKRIPIRLTYDDSYFDDRFQGVPLHGYTPIFEKLLVSAEVRLNTDYFSDRNGFDSLAKKVLYTGPIDRFFDYRYGKLEYRALRFEHELINVSDFQGIGQINYTSEEVAYTRIIEHKHFAFARSPITWITREYPIYSTSGEDEMYPVRDQNNLRMLREYQSMAQLHQFRDHYFGGRLAEYRYYDMHQAIAAALRMSNEIAKSLSASSSTEDSQTSTRQSSIVRSPAAVGRNGEDRELAMSNDRGAS